MIEWKRHVMQDRITFDGAWTKMGLHHDVPRTHLVDDVLAAAKHFQRATSDYVFPSPKTGGQMSGFTKMVKRLIKEAEVDKFTMHDLRRSLRTIMSRCGYDNEIQRLCVGQKPGGIDQVYNHDEQWIIRKMAFEAAHDYIPELVGAERTGKVRASAEAKSARSHQSRAARPSSGAFCGWGCVASAPPDRYSRTASTR